MTDLVGLREQLSETEHAIRELELLAAERPTDESLAINMASLQKRMGLLQEEFSIAASDIGLDVCSYRLFAAGNRETVRGIAEGLVAFQELISLAYDAIKNGPKRVSRVAEDAARESALGFGYSFSGSTGFVLTLPRELLLLPEVSGPLDDAVKAVVAMAQAHDSESILTFAKALGPAPVRALHKWATAHARSGLGTGITWQRGRDVTASLLIQQPELEQLRALLSTTSEVEESEVIVTAELVGANVHTRTFRLKSDEIDIRGRFSDAISPEHTVVLPKMYRARLLKTTRTYFSTDEDQVSYFLLELQPLEI